MDSPNPYLIHRDTLEGAIASVCRRFHLSGPDAEDFASEFRLRLVEEDYATLREFEGRSSLRTYLHVVVMRAFQDWRNARWGKWRVSAEAKRLGPLAERLEILIVRDRHTLGEAAEILRTNFGLSVSEATLDSLAARFPSRHGRQHVADAALEETPAANPLPDRSLEQDAAAIAARSAGDALARALARMPAEDQLILRMRFQDCLTVAQVARALHLEQKPLYRRIDRLLRQLREDLEQGGLTRAVISDALAQGGFDLATRDTAGGPELFSSRDAAPGPDQTARWG
jgi:RNA polymerase sigma factor for flagellar operon FliA